MKHEEPMAYEPRTLTQKWDKTFLKNPDVTHRKVLFPTQFGVTLAADCYAPKVAAPEEALPAVAVFGPFGTVKEQAAGFYAQALAARGFFAIAPDPSFLGESGGHPRFTAAPDINTEDIRAAVDFLSTQPGVNEDRVAVLGLGGWGALALNAAAIDTRISAVVTVSLQDPGRIATKGLFDSADDPDVRRTKKQALNLQRTKDAQRQHFTRTGTEPSGGDLLPSAAFHAYYHTQRGFHKNAPNCLGGWNQTGTMAYLYWSPTERLGEIQAPVLMIYCDEAPDRYFTLEAYDRLRGKDNHLLSLSGVKDMDLLDCAEVIPFSEIAQFLKKKLTDSTITKRRSFAKAAPTGGAVLLDFSKTPDTPAVRLLSAMLNATAVFACKSDAAAAQSLLHAKDIALVVPMETAAVAPAVLQFLEARNFKGKSVLCIFVTENGIDPDGAKKQICDCLPYCTCIGALSVPPSVGISVLSQKLSAMANEARKKAAETF